METLTLPGKLDSLKAIRDFVAQAAEAANLDKKPSYRLNLAVDEIATNIILHGYQEAGVEGDVVVRADIDHRALTIYLEDTGATYNPSMEGLPENLDQPLDKRQEGGLGVYLAMTNVDQFTYKRVGDRNIHTFVIERVDGSGT